MRRFGPKCWPSRQLRKLDAPCASLPSSCGPSRQLRKLDAPCASLHVPMGPFQQHNSSSRHVPRFGPHEGHHGTPKRKKHQRFPDCASFRTPVIHVYSQVKEHVLQRAARRPNAREERWRARPGCGGERGGGITSHCRSALPALRASTTVSKKKYARAHTSSPPLLPGAQ